jgi:pimeloyl-ACP methyl ester carboxylesterase
MLGNDVEDVSPIRRAERRLLPSSAEALIGFSTTSLSRERGAEMSSDSQRMATTRRTRRPAFHTAIEALETRTLLSAQAFPLYADPLTVVPAGEGPTPWIADVATAAPSALPQGDDAANSSQSLQTRLVFPVRQHGITRQASISRIDGGSAFIEPDQTTWLLIHGRNSGPFTPSWLGLASAIHEARPDDQILVLNWRTAAASGRVGGEGENFIVPVGTAAAAALVQYGFSGADINIVGHSWGAYVGDEIAERVPGGVNSIVALDPARDFPGGYNPEGTSPGGVRNTDFSAHSAFSWAFHNGDGLPFGSQTTPTTAREAFVVDGTTHSGVLGVFANLLRDPQGPGEFFQLDRLLAHQPGPWIPNEYDSQGNPEASGPFEGVVAAAGQTPLSFTYVPLVYAS